MNYPFLLMTTNKWYFSGEQSVTGIKRKITCLILRVLILATYPIFITFHANLRCWRDVVGSFLARRSLERVWSKSRKRVSRYNNAAGYAGYFQVHKNLLFNIGRR